MVSENHDVVRIMTIHKSKGLEFPVVFLAGCGKRFPLSDARGELLLHKDLGFGIDYIDFEKSIKIPNITKKVISKAMKNEGVSEEIRKLYVALTRAKEKLIVTAAIKPSKSGMEELEEICRDTVSMNSTTVLEKTHYIDWLMPVAMNNSERWIYKRVSYTEALEGVYEETVEKETAASGREISGFMEYKYPYEDISDIPSKVSVSELKSKKNEKSSYTVMTPVPDFLKPEQEVRGAAKGTIIHYVMQKIPFAHVMDEEYVKGFVESLGLNGILSEKEMRAVDCKSISEFYNSDLGKRIRRSDKVYKEAAFETEISAKLVDEEYPEDEKVILQGVIDCYFEEEDGWVLVDYKSDYYESIEEIKEKYTTQLELYADAIEKITEKKVKCKYLYLFFNNDVVEL